MTRQDEPTADVRAAVRSLTAVELDALVEALDALPDGGHGGSWGASALKRALNDEEARRARAGEAVIYTGRNR